MNSAAAQNDLVVISTISTVGPWSKLLSSPSRGYVWRMRRLARLGEKTGCADIAPGRRCAGVTLAGEMTGLDILPGLWRMLRWAGSRRTASDPLPPVTRFTIPHPSNHGKPDR